MPTPEELEEQIEELATEMDARFDAIEKILGDWTKQITPLEMYGDPDANPPIPSAVLKKENELQNGEYPLAIQQRRLNFIAENLAGGIATLSNRVSVLEARPSGSVSSPTDNETFPLPVVSGVAHDAGDVPGFGNGFHLKSGNFEALIFISDYDNALRILTNHKANADGGHTYAIETEGQQRIDVETFGVGVSYWPPRKNPDGSDFPLTELDKQGGKSIILKSHAPDNHRARYAQIYTGLPGQGLQIGVSAGKHPDGKPMANVMVNPTIQIEPDGTKSIG